MNEVSLVEGAASLAMVMIAASFVPVLIRLLRGPELADRVVALDVLSILSAGLIFAAAVLTDRPGLLDVAISLALVVFLGTVVFSRALVRRKRR